MHQPGVAGGRRRGRRRGGFAGRLGRYDFSHHDLPMVDRGGRAVRLSHPESLPVCDSGQRVPLSTRAETASTLSLSTKPGPVRIGRPPPSGVEVGGLQVHQHDRQVALQVLLLVDREREVAVLMAARRSGVMSKPPMMVLRPAVCEAPMADLATIGPVPKMASMSGLACSRAAICASWPAGSVSEADELGLHRALEGVVRPWQRSSRPTLVCSWRAHRTLLAPSVVNCSPAPSPATVSSWPMWVTAPSSL